VKAQCEKCKEIVPLEFRVDGNGIRVKCGACGGDYFVAGEETGDRQPATGNRQPASSDGEMVCPKCGEGQKPAEACRKCGLVIANWDPEKAEAEFGDVTVVREMWAAVEKEWERGELHDAFIEECRKSELLPFAALRYRQRGASERLAQIRKLAEQAFLVAPRPEVKPQKSRTILLIAMVVIVLAMAYMLMRGFAVPE